MPINEEFYWEDASRKMEYTCKILLRELPAAEEVYQDLLAAQDTATDLAWGRILFQTVDTKTTTLVVDATAKTVSCRAGANLFANVQVGRNVQLTGFTNAGNNQTTEITSKVSNDAIGIADATGLVDETDTAARAQENPEQYQLDKIDALQATALAVHELWDALDNASTIAVKDRAALLRDFS